MNTRAWLLALSLAASGCIGDLNTQPQPPPPPVQPEPPPPVVAHWKLDAPNAAPDVLWIEADGTFSERSTLPVLVVTSISYLTTGTWTFAGSQLDLFASHGGDYVFTVALQPDGGMTLAGTSTWSFHPDQP
jgi:hypothetical protein